MNQVLKLLGNDFKIPFTNMLRNLEMNNQAVGWGYFSRIRKLLLKRNSSKYLRKKMPILCNIFQKSEEEKTQPHLFYETSITLTKILKAKICKTISFSPKIIFKY